MFAGADMSAALQARHGLLEWVFRRWFRETMFIDQGLTAELGRGDCYPLKHYPAILASRIILA